MTCRCRDRVFLLTDAGDGHRFLGGGWLSWHRAAALVGHDPRVGLAKHAAQPPAHRSLHRVGGRANIPDGQGLNGRKSLCSSRLGNLTRQRDQF